MGQIRRRPLVCRNRHIDISGVLSASLTSVRRLYIFIRIDTLTSSVDYFYAQLVQIGLHNTWNTLFFSDSSPSPLLGSRPHHGFGNLQRLHLILLLSNAIRNAFEGLLRHYCLPE